MNARPPLDVELRTRLGEIDIYVLDQLMRGRIQRGMRVLDVGCGSGRNLVYLLAEGVDVTAVDQDEACVQAVRHLASTLGQSLGPQRALRAEASQLPLPDASYDVVVCSAVLHFARDAEHFGAMVRELYRVLAPRGLLFTRLASNIGLRDRMVDLGKGRFTMPDGTDRYLVDEPMLVGLTAQLGATLADPIKTTIVQGLRAMTTWVLRKAGEPSAGHA